MTCTLLAAGQATVASAAAPAAPSPESEPNDTSATATAIVSGQRARGNIVPNADVDYYSFAATAGDKVYAATMTSGSASSSANSLLTLLAGDGTTTIEADDDNGSFGTTSSSIAGAAIPTTGTYFLKVSHATGTNTLRPYDLYLQLRSAAPTPEAEANDTTATANPLPAGGGRVSERTARRTPISTR